MDPGKTSRLAMLLEPVNVHDKKLRLGEVRRGSRDVMAAPEYPELKGCRGHSQGLWLPLQAWV